MKARYSQVISSAIVRLHRGDTVWLYTVVASEGISVPPPGEMIACDPQGECIDGFDWRWAGIALPNPRDLEGISAMGLLELRPSVAESREAVGPRRRITLLAERLLPDLETSALLAGMQLAIEGRADVLREIDLDGEERRLFLDWEGGGKHVERAGNRFSIRVACVVRLLILGISPLTRHIARLAVELRYEVSIYDPCADVCRDFAVEGAEVVNASPDEWTTLARCHRATAILIMAGTAVDPHRLIDWMRWTPAFYVGFLFTPEEPVHAFERDRELDNGRSQARIKIFSDSISCHRPPFERALVVVTDIVESVDECGL